MGAGTGSPRIKLNYRANIDALKRAGCTDILAISAVGSLREELAPGRFVAVDQFIDRTGAATSSFFGEGVVAHVAWPTRSARDCRTWPPPRRTGRRRASTGTRTYVAIDGPQFSTRAESRLYRQWGCDVIGMTAMPEAKLAREAELPYALIGDGHRL